MCVCVCVCARARARARGVFICLSVCIILCMCARAHIVFVSLCILVPSFLSERLHMRARARVGKCVLAYLRVYTPVFFSVCVSGCVLTPPPLLLPFDLLPLLLLHPLFLLSIHHFPPQPPPPPPHPLTSLAATPVHFSCWLACEKRLIELADQNRFPLAALREESVLSGVCCDVKATLFLTRGDEKRGTSRRERVGEIGVWSGAECER